jgi:hypothetical protein
MQNNAEVHAHVPLLQPSVQLLSVAVVSPQQLSPLVLVQLEQLNPVRKAAPVVSVSVHAVGDGQSTVPAGGAPPLSVRSIA